MRLNGYELTVPSAEEGVAFTKAIAEGKITKTVEIASWLKKHSKRKLGHIFMRYLVKIYLLVYTRMTVEDRRTLPRLAILLSRAINLYPD